MSPIQETRFHARRKSRTVSNVIVKAVKAREVPAFRSVHWQGTEGDCLRIPPLPPMLLNCTIIDITYLLEIEVVPHGLSSRLNLSVPITIGTIPLTDFWSVPIEFLPSDVKRASYCRSFCAADCSKTATWNGTTIRMSCFELVELNCVFIECCCLFNIPLSRFSASILRRIHTRRTGICTEIHLLRLVQKRIRTARTEQILTELRSSFIWHQIRVN